MPLHRALRRLTREVVRAAAPRTRPRHNQRGDGLDPQVSALLSLLALLPVGRDPPPVAALRANMRFQSRIAAARARPIPTRESTVTGLKCRWYQPDRPRGAVVYLHGGGWVVGDLDTHDALCRRVALDSQHAVVSVDYPLAPEAPWPAAIHHLADTFVALASELSAMGFSRQQLVLAGDSAGGNLATMVCVVLRDRGEEQPGLQLLIYPGVDAHLRLPSHAEFAEGLILTHASIVRYLSLYGVDAEHPLGCPLHNSDVAGLAPALVTVAGFDPLRDEGLAYADKLRSAGVEAVVFDERSLTHGYVQYDGLVDEASAAVDRITAHLRDRRPAEPA